MGGAPSVDSRCGAADVTCLVLLLLLDCLFVCLVLLACTSAAVHDRRSTTVVEAGHRAARGAVVEGAAAGGGPCRAAAEAAAAADRHAGASQGTATPHRRRVRQSVVAGTKPTLPFPHFVRFVLSISFSLPFRPLTASSNVHARRWSSRWGHGYWLCVTHSLLVLLLLLPGLALALCGAWHRHHRVATLITASSTARRLRHHLPQNRCFARRPALTAVPLALALAARGSCRRCHTPTPVLRGVPVLRAAMSWRRLRRPTTVPPLITPNTSTTERTAIRMSRAPRACRRSSSASA